MIRAAPLHPGTSCDGRLSSGRPRPARRKRTLAGTRITLGVATAAALVALTMGVAWGAIAGWCGGRIDEAMMRIVDALYALPFMFVVILLMVLFGRSVLLVFLGIGAVEWLTMARVVRGQMLALKDRPFVIAAEAAGARPFAIVTRHMLPNVAGVAIAYLLLTIPQVVMIESFLSFLGLGVQEPLTSLGILLKDGADDSGYRALCPAAARRDSGDIAGVPDSGGRETARSDDGVMSFPEILTEPARGGHWRGLPPRSKAAPPPCYAWSPSPYRGGFYSFMSAIFSVAGLGVMIDGRPVVHDVSFDIAAGQCVAPVGASGSGKSQTCMAPFRPLARHRFGIGKFVGAGPDRPARDQVCVQDTGPGCRLRLPAAADRAQPASDDRRSICARRGARPAPPRPSRADLVTALERVGLDRAGSGWANIPTACPAGSDSAC